MSLFTTLCNLLNSLLQNMQKKDAKTLEQMIPGQYFKYRKVFEESASHELPPFRKWDHAIDLKPEAIPENNCKIYPLSPVEQTALNAFLDGMTLMVIFNPQFPPSLLPSSLSRRRMVNSHLVQDYCQLNSLMIQEPIPSPSHFRCHRQTQGCSNIHQIWCSMGVQ